MVRNKMKWRFTLLFALLLLNVFTKSLPLEKRLPSVIVSDSSYSNLDAGVFSATKVISDTESSTKKLANHLRLSNNTILEESDGSNNVTSVVSRNITRNLFRNVRPGQTVDNYAVQITFDGDSFMGEVVIDVRLEFATREDDIVFHLEDLSVQQVLVGLHNQATAQAADFSVDDGLIEISPSQVASSYVVIIQYTGQISNTGTGIFRGDFNDHQYLGMNLYPTHARRVFPCMDELQGFTTITFTFNDVPFTNIVSNSVTEDDNANQFRALQVPPSLWGMVAHNFINIAIPTTNVQLLGRSGLNQDSMANTAINHFFQAYNEYMGRAYFDINVNQDGRLSIFALPDTNANWNALSTICIWEPYILMKNNHAVMQLKTSLVKIAEAMARQWYGYVVYPENWKDQWAIQGLVSHAAYDVVKEFQTSNFVEDNTLLDMNTIFVTDVIQEALYMDGYNSVPVLNPNDDIVDENMIRHQILGHLNYKAPAIMRMAELVLSDQNNDYIQIAGQILLNRRTLAPVSSFDFYDAVTAAVPPSSLPFDEVSDYFEPWVKTTGYPVLNVAWRTPNTVFVSQERFSFTNADQGTYLIPITFTTSIENNYNNIYPVMLTDNTIQLSLPQTLDEDDYVLFNIQGQGFYRVNYDTEYWERIIEALDDPDRRKDIHPLNRATLIDDALNLARAGKLDYDIAFRVVLTWVHETEYAPWKAFIRNMEFLKRRLEFLVGEDDDLDPDMYLRMVRRTISAFEDEVGFSPDPAINEPPMTSLARGIVMDHACRSKYIPCIAAAIDWFYDPNTNQNTDPAINPDIPQDLRPAVFCTMVREAGAEATNLLNDFLETDLSHWERLVVLESFGCSEDAGFINSLLMDTISANSAYGVEERSKILAAVAKSNYENLRRVISFMQINIPQIFNMYGGPAKVEELLFVIAEQIPSGDLEFDFRVWISSTTNNLGSSEDVGLLALQLAQENLQWDSAFMDYVYEWIDENDAHTLVVSFTLVCLSAFITLFY